MWASSLFPYFFSLIKYTEGELVVLDRLVRKQMRVVRSHHRAASIERCLLPRLEGGRGVMGMAYLYERCVVSAFLYVVNGCGGCESLRDVLQHMKWMKRRGRWSLLTAFEKVVNHYDDLCVSVVDGKVCLDGVCVDSRKFVAAVKDSQMEVSVGTLKCKRLHGQLYSLLDGEGVDKRLSVEWLRDGRLKSESEGLLVAAQDGVVRTRVYAVKIMGISGPVKCRMCGVSEETVSHVLCCCGKWSWTLYKDRHDHALRPLFVFLCNYFNLRTATNTSNATAISMKYNNFSFFKYNSISGLLFRNLASVGKHTSHINLLILYNCRNISTRL